MQKMLMVTCLVAGMPIWLSPHAAADDQAACLRECQIEREGNIKICQQEDGIGDCRNQHNIVQIYGTCRTACYPHHYARPYKPPQQSEWDKQHESNDD